MLHIKDSKNLFEFTHYFKSPTKAFSNIVEVLMFTPFVPLQAIYSTLNQRVIRRFCYFGCLFSCLFPRIEIFIIFSAPIYKLFYEGKKDDIVGQIFTDRLFVLIMELIEMFVNILYLAIDVDKTISSLIEKTNLLSKISFVFSTSID